MASNQQRAQSLAETRLAMPMRFDPSPRSDLAGDIESGYLTDLQSLMGRLTGWADNLGKLMAGRTSPRAALGVQLDTPFPPPGKLASLRTMQAISVGGLELQPEQGETTHRPQQQRRGPGFPSPAEDLFGLGGETPPAALDMGGGGEFGTAEASAVPGLDVEPAAAGGVVRTGGSMAEDLAATAGGGEVPVGEGSMDRVADLLEGSKEALGRIDRKLDALERQTPELRQG